MTEPKTDQWQPIDTAPRVEGQGIICWRPGWICPEILVWKTNDRIANAHEKGGMLEYSASYFGDPYEWDDYGLALPDRAPTHWLPYRLPEAK